ncbi:Auxin-responsive protein IAA33 [Hibiscus syriacus]|uniref:Auxin-responsive protein n=1 Tax=Hibiscus syriacus TaxID=106335 RepID=A0A6A2Z672_HIBSY|nr:auxin-responsive protein IAA33-like [Hibiscus syriacus]KAE8687177.1 Auxin-responsive protein IAA33 [Hibiscus syriacus]
MNSFESKRSQDNLKRIWQNTRFVSSSSHLSLSSNPRRCFPCLDDDDLVSTVVPLVTVVLEGRSICQRISLHKHGSYQSLAKALRQMFVDDDGVTSDNDLDLSNAVPGHLVAYEDMENDLLLAGDLDWQNFVRVAKRIRILPAKGSSRKGRGGA